VKISLEHSCGHSSEHEVPEGKLGASRKRTLKNTLCPKCWQQKQRQEGLDAAAEAERLGLPAMLHDASEAEILEAELRRSQFFQWWSHYKGEMKKHPVHGEALNLVKSKREPRWWLHHRRHSQEYLMELMIDEAVHHQHMLRCEPEVKRRMAQLQASPLHGSEAQVRWARQIREHFIHRTLMMQVCLEESLADPGHWAQSLQTIRHELESVPGELAREVQVMSSKSSAVFWIEFRDKTPVQMAAILGGEERLVHLLDVLNGKMSFLLDM
jgi:hypothetical protein